MEQFGPATRQWFSGTLGSPTPVQSRGWPTIASGAHSLLLAPTGSGKTLAAFLYAIDRLAHEPEPADRDARPGVRVLYVSPLKALVVDVERSVKVPLAGIARAAEQLGVAVRLPRMAIRTGDTPPRARRAQQKTPAEILATTPESLYVLLGSNAREQLRSVETVIVDEVHALAPNKRGAHLAISLERLARLCGREPQRIGLSATAAPAAEVARFLGGDRDVCVVDATVPPHVDLRIQVPGESFAHPVDPPGPARTAGERGVWPAIYRTILAIVRAHQSTIVFVNSRAQSERICRRLCELAGEPIARAHHGSLAHEQRTLIEADLKEGRLRAIVATSSLELGIDMGAVDHVVLVESPGAVARGLQRVGRAGHQVGALSRATVLPKTPHDLLDCVVLTDRMRRGEIEPTTITRCPLDVLAQQIVAASAVDEWNADELLSLLRRAAPFAALEREPYEAVLGMLAGRYPSTELADLPARIVWDRVGGTLRGRASSKAVALASGGTIVDRGLYRVVTASDGGRVGELDEEMVHETRRGDVITLGATSWRVEQLGPDRVTVSPAPGRVGRLPFWHGDKPGRRAELGRALGAFVRELWSEPDRIRWLVRNHGLEPESAAQLESLLVEQHAATGTLPTDRRLTIERFRDELGDWRVCLVSHWGARVHAGWALAIGAALAARSGFEARVLWRDDGLSLHLPAGLVPERPLLVPRPSELDRLVLAELPGSALFAGHFRENAARALLLARRGPGARTPLWAQRHRAARLLAVARAHPDFPIVLESYRSCLEEALDLPSLRSVLAAVERGEIEIDEVETRRASPFARELAFAEVAAYMYEGDLPLAERRVGQAAVDRELLAQIVGGGRSDELELDPRAVASVVPALQRTTPTRRARSADELHDVLRALGDRSENELVERSTEDPASWLEELARTGRAVKLETAPASGVADDACWIAAEDAERYDAARAASERGDSARAELLGRWARHRGPFERPDLGRFAWSSEQVDRALDELVRSGKLRALQAATAGSAPSRWCDVEMLARLRREERRLAASDIEPVDPTAFARFLVSWHGLDGAGTSAAARAAAVERASTGRPHLQASPPPLGSPSLGREGLLDGAMVTLEGLCLPFDELERAILPARLGRRDPMVLDDACARGEIVWVADGRLAPGSVALLRRSHAPLLAPEPLAEAAERDTDRALLQALTESGASYLSELAAALPTVSIDELLEGIWRLAWAGHVTHDGFAALRGRKPRATSSKTSARPPHTRRRGRLPESTGRWTLSPALASAPPGATQRAHARACMLLDRYGVVAREMAVHEQLPGGFAPIYDVLAVMAERGLVQRGTFVSGLGAAQFARPEVVDALRSARDSAPGGGAFALSTLDPAMPFGALAPWPALRAPDAPAPRRAPATSVVLVDGVPALYVERSGRRLWSFRDAEPGAQAAATAALRSVAEAAPRRTLRIEAVDGIRVRSSPWLGPLRSAGFEEEPRGLVLEAARRAEAARPARRSATGGSGR